jgi:S1-C subfamily serine protease
MVVSNSQETVDTDLSVGSLSTYCRYGLFGTPSFDRRSAIGDVIFRCTVRNVLIQKIKTVSVVLREHRLNNRMVALVEVGSNPDGSLFSNQEAIAGFKRIAEVVRNIGFVREIHPDGYHCHGDATDLRLPKFMRDPCEEATRAVPVEAYRGDGAAPVAVERPQAMAPAAPPTATSKAQRFLGTGFFVSKDGNALTNAHVVEGCRQISVNMEGQTAAAKVLARDDRNDLALLTTDLHPADLIHWRLAVRQGEDVVVYGFPLSGVLASGGNVAVGNVTALAGLGNDSRFLQISAPVQPGNSGGPLLDRNGTVVGIVVSKLNALEIASATGDIPQNVNFAIKASVAAAFLDAQRVAHAESAGVGALSTPDIAERAKSFTVQVVCVR